MYFCTERLSLSPEYYEALKLGEVLVAYGKVMMIGPGGAGKTSLRRSLMNIKLPLLASSTLLANALSVKYQWAKAGDEASQYWIEVSEEDEIDELATLLSMVVNLLLNPSNEGSVSQLLESALQSLAINLFQPSSQGALSPSSAVDKIPSAEAVARRILSEVHRRLMNQPQQQEQKPEVLLRLWDCGGQSVFLNILPAFLTPRTLFMLTFDASKDLNEKLTFPAIQGGDVVHTEDYHLSTTEMILQWMATIHSHLSSKKVGEGQQKFPRIMLVGTHRDKLADDSSDSSGLEQCIRDQLHSLYRGKYYADLLLPSPLYFVDNTRAGEGENEDPAVKMIRQAVHEFVLTDLSVHTPVTWVLFRKVMQSMFKDEPVVKLQEVYAIAEACRIPSEAVPSVLNFYHQLGVFLYFANVPGLQDVVITDPQWLITNFAKVLSPKGLSDHGMERLWELLHSKGVLVERLYKTVLAKAGIEPQALINLLDHFLLATPIPPEPKHPYDDGKWYFVPSMLSARSLPEPVQTTPVCEAEALELVFRSGYVPPGFFARLVASVAKVEQCTILFQCIDHLSVTFRYGEVDELHLRESSQTITVHMSRQIQGPHSPSFDSTCHAVLGLLHASIDKVKIWLPCAEMDSAFKCAKCMSRNSMQFIVITPTTCTTSVLSCLKCRKYSNPTTSQKYWLKPMTSSRFHPLSSRCGK